MSLITTNLVGEFMRSIFGVVDDLHTSEEEKAEMKFRISSLAKSMDLAQIEVNKEEAKSSKMFVSGWRPFVGWTCGFALAWTFVLSPFIQALVFYIAAFTGTVIDLNGLPVIELAGLLPILLGMLGLGTMRTYEKVNGVASTELGETPVKFDSSYVAKQALETDTLRLKKGKPRGS